MKRRILLTFGTRPEAVKMAPVVRALRESSTLEPVVCLTGQHREMVEQILPLFEVRSDFDLDVMSHNQTPSDVAAAIFRELPAVLATVAPDLVLVQGDTSTAMAAAVASHYAHLPVGHVEAGLRTGQMYQPFPEEANRKVITAVSTLHFAPTRRAVAALESEGIVEGVFLTGNTVVDALHFLLEHLPELPAPEGRLLLVTAHRRESFGEPMRRICRAIQRIVRAHDDVVALYPVHPNPNVREPVYSILGEEPRVKLVEPLDYLRFVQVMAHCYFALTDSGGVQEEAPVLGKPVLVMREHTERLEAVEAGCAELVGTNEDLIVERAGRLLENRDAYLAMSSPTSPFGDGHAAARIVDAAEAFLGSSIAEPEPATP
ncbi:MAG TPA: UDP-N-acetylglucosamine 2-epimerase (non-hydrolyzing) [Chloroflexota bacterium]|nr:UDP-N-acetylglucosamine 2-epimerase (non-hydrolyzing) [Chloroflexota bacterium]